MGRASSFPVPPEYLLCLLWAKSSRVILMSCSKHFSIVNHRFLSPSPNQYEDIYAEHIKALDTIEKTITPCKTFAFGRWHHGIIHYTLHMPAIYRKAEWPCQPAVHICAARGRKAADNHLCLRTANHGSWEKPCEQKQLLSALLLCSSQTFLAVTDRMLARHIFLPTTTVMLPFTALGQTRKLHFLSLSASTPRTLPAWPFCLLPPLPRRCTKIIFKPQGKDAEAPASSCCTNYIEHTRIPCGLAIPLLINAAPFPDAGRALGTKAQHTWMVPTPHVTAERVTRGGRHQPLYLGKAATDLSSLSSLCSWLTHQSLSCNFLFQQQKFTPF